MELLLNHRHRLERIFKNILAYGNEEILLLVYFSVGNDVIRLCLEEGFER